MARALYIFLVLALRSFIDLACVSVVSELNVSEWISPDRSQIVIPRRGLLVRHRDVVGGPRVRAQETWSKARADWAHWPADPSMIT